MGRPHQAVIIGFAVLALGVTLHAQPAAPPAIPPSGSPLTLAQAIDIALANNPDTRTAWLEARAAELGVGRARSAYLPEVDILANATRSRSSAVGAHATTTVAPSI